jgi:hypothetical protein
LASTCFDVAIRRSWHRRADGAHRRRSAVHPRVRDQRSSAAVSTA